MSADMLRCNLTWRKDKISFVVDIEKIKFIVDEKRTDCLRHIRTGIHSRSCVEALASKGRTASIARLLPVTELFFPPGNIFHPAKFSITFYIDGDDVVVGIELNIASIKKVMLFGADGHASVFM